MVPLIDRRMFTVATALVGVLSRMGPPAILHCDNGGEFEELSTEEAKRSRKKKRNQRRNGVVDVDEVMSNEFIELLLKEVAGLWPHVKIINGAVRKPSTQGKVENMNKFIRRKLHAWMSSTANIRWATLGLPQVLRHSAIWFCPCLFSFFPAPFDFCVWFFHFYFW